MKDDQRAPPQILTEPDPDVDAAHKQVGEAIEALQPLAKPGETFYS